MANEKKKVAPSNKRVSKTNEKRTHQETVEEKPTETVETIENEVIQSITKPLQYLDDTLEAEQQRQKDTFKTLLSENARLEVEKKKLHEKFEDLRMKCDVIKADLQNEKESVKTKSERIAEMENEIKLLIQARRNKNMQDSAQKIKEKYGPPPPAPDPTVFDPEEQDPRIRDFQVRLIRITSEGAEKDQRIEELAHELRLTQEFAQELQAEVDQKRAEEIKEKMEEDQNQNKRTHYYDPANVITTGHVEKSEVCRIQ